MLNEAEYRQRRWATYGVVELEKELQHLRHAMPASPAIPDLERCLDERRAEVERLYGGKRIGAQ
jgi:hypothetical protein